MNRRRLLDLALQLPILTLVALMLFWMLSDSAVRIAYPYDIEWMEGGMLVHALRFREGLPVYAEPSADWIPYIYPPLYSWLVGMLGEPSYAIGRTLSLVSTLAAAGALGFGLWREGLKPGIALAGAGLFLSCYDDSGFFYDLVRSDTLALALAAWSFVLVRMAGPRSVIVGGLLLALSFLAKHNYAMFGLGMAIWLYLQDKKLALRFVLASAAPALLAVIVLQIATGGYFLTYLLEVPGAHPLVGERAWPQAEKELVTCVLWANIGALVAGLAQLKRFSRDTLYWLFILVTATIAVILMRAHHGGFINVLMPGHWAVSFVAAALLGSLLKRWDHPALLAAVVALLSWQLWDGRWDRERLRPTAQDIAAGDALVEQIREIDGPVFAPHFPWYPYLAGKEPSLPLIALWDIDHKRGPLKAEAAVVDQALADKKWAAVLTPRKHIKHGIELHYRKGPSTEIKGKVFTTRTGWRVQPRVFWVPRD